jgi:hypothetical protein
MNLEKELAKLQDAFAMVDLFVRRTRDTAEMEILVKKLQSIRIRMDGNQNHKRPHVHIDYGNKYHAASYAIDTGERLVGDLDNNYDHAVRQWIAEYKPKVLQAWNLIQAGQNADAIVCELRGEN